MQKKVCCQTAKGAIALGSTACKPGTMMRIAAWLAFILTVAPTAAAQAASLYAAAGIWTGLYNCAQGQTSLELDVTVADPRHLQALFYFHGAPANPFVPAGCFLMQGAFNAATSTLSLSPTKWLLRPRFYIAVGLTGVLAADGSLAGNISGPRCSSFSLTRAGVQTQHPMRCRAPDSLSAS